MKNKIKNNIGFTLLEITMAMGIASFIALVAYSMKDSSNKAISRSLVSSESSFLKNLVIANMSNPAACERTFAYGGPQPIVNPALTLYDKNSNPFLAPGQEILEEKGATSAGNKPLFTINSIESLAVPGSNNTLKIKVTYTLRPSLSKVTKFLTRTFEVDVYIVKSGANVKNCFVDTAGMIKKAVEKSCKGNGATWNAATSICTHNVAVTSAVVTGTKQSCAAGEFFQQSGNVAGVTTYTCASYTMGGTVCAAGYFMKGFNADGTALCEKLADKFPTAGSVLSATAAGYTQYNLNCPVDQVLRRLDPYLCVPKVIVGGCGPYEYISDVSSSGAVSCSPFTKKTAGVCPAGTYLRAINSDGSVPVGGCAPLTIPATCPAGYALTAVDGAGNAAWCQRL